MYNESLMISIIIPVYNVEKYINQCVDSVISQTYSNFELLLVDDGSTDNSAKMCDEYALKDSRIKIIHKSNGGASSARNVGIDVAIGDYIMFMDSDDFWNDTTALEGLVNRISETKADVVCFGYKEYDEINGYGKGVDVSNFCNKQYDNDIILHMISKGIYTSSVWSKAVKKEVILNNKIYFKEKVTSEDLEWNAHVLIKADTFAVFSKNFYSYRQREGSVVHSIKYENLEMLSDNIKICVDLGKEIENTSLNEAYYNYVSYQYITFFKVAMKCKNDERTENLRKRMKEYRWLLKYHLNKKVKVIYWFNKLFGYDLMFIALKLYSKNS